MAEKWKIDPQKLPSVYFPFQCAQLNQRKLSSKHYILNIDDKESLKSAEELLTKNNFLKTLKKTTFSLSIYGWTTLFWTKINNDWSLMQSDTAIMPIKNATDDLIEITIFAQVIKGSGYQYWVYETHTPKGIYRTITKTDAKEDMNYTKAFSEGSQVSNFEVFEDKGIFIKPFVPTGIMTAVIVSNALEGNSDSNIYGVPDTIYAVSEIDLLNDSYINLKNTLRYGRPKPILTTEEGTETYEQDSDGKLATNNIIDMDGDYIHIVLSSGVDENSLKMFIPNPQLLEVARKDFKESLSAALTASGYAGADDTDSAQKTALEVSQIRDSEFGAMESKVSLIQIELKKLLKAIGEISDWTITDEDGIDLQRLDVREETEMVDNLIKAIDNGLITTKKAITIYNKVSPAEAITIAKEIAKEKEAKIPTVAPLETPETPETQDPNEDKLDPDKESDPNP